MIPNRSASLLSEEHPTDSESISVLVMTEAFKMATIQARATITTANWEMAAILVLILTWKSCGQMPLPVSKNNRTTITTQILHKTRIIRTVIRTMTMPMMISLTASISSSIKLKIRESIKTNLTITMIRATMVRLTTILNMDCLSHALATMVREVALAPSAARIFWVVKLISSLRKSSRIN